MPMTTADDEQAAHRRRPFLDVVALRPLLADPLAEPERVEQADVRRHQDDHRANASSRPWISSTVIGRARVRVAELAPQGVDEAVEGDPARRLDQHDVAVAQARHDGGRARVSVVGHADDPRSGRGRPRARPRRSPAAPSPTTTSRSTVPAAASPTSRWPSSLASPSSSISPRTATRRPGSPASRSSAASDRAAARRCSCRRRRSPPPRRTSWTRCGADQPLARPAAISSSGQPGRPTDRRPGEGVVDRQPAERRDRRPAGARRPVAQVKRIPSSPAESTASAPTSASVGEPVASRSARPSASPIRRTIGSSALRIAVPSAGSASTQLALGRLDRLERADPRQVDRLDRGHHADPRPGDPGQVGDLAADVHAHLEDRRLVLRAQSQHASAAGRPRCSGCPRCAASGTAARGRPRRPPWSRSWRCSR